MNASKRVCTRSNPCVYILIVELIEKYGINNGIQIRTLIYKACQVTGRVLLKIIKIMTFLNTVLYQGMYVCVYVCMYVLCMYVCTM